jgi:hypothetical protein
VITGDVPDNIIDSYKVSKQILALTDSEAIGFTILAGTDYDCDVLTNRRTYKEVILTNNKGVYIDTNLAETETKHVYVLSGETASIGSVLLGYFTETDGVIEILEIGKNPLLPE